MSDASIAVVSNQSPEIIYTGTWTNNGTHRAATNPGCSLVFNYNGTQIWVSGTLYPLDGKIPWSVTFTLDDKYPLSLVAQDVYQVQNDTGLWESQDDLTGGQHQLTLKVTFATPNTPFLLDQLFYVPTSTDPRAGVTYTNTAPPQVTVTVSAVSEPGSSVPVGAIVGGAVGGLVLLIIAGLLGFWFYRKRRSSTKPFYYGNAHPSEMLQENASGVSFFNTSASPSPSSPTSPTAGGQTLATHGHGGGVSSEYARSLHSTRPASDDSHDFTITPYQTSAISSNTGGLPTSPPIAHHTSTRSKAAEAGVPFSPPGLQKGTTYHADSGIRFVASSTEGDVEDESDGAPLPADVPPIYAPS
ncbi:hypothetical protein EIP91_003785 [Steccherinum ochraceum]|uniref:Mid2 domain-containing protein n=1 Tax=Steccherinum ochraceum TaxID=92696 RepID=A0A4R0RBA9_9APHY|nr:hypothetical protein EIP91_003785 [Steccherinum ochraceum]